MNKTTYHKNIKIGFLKLKTKRTKKFDKIIIIPETKAGIGNRINDMIFALAFDKPKKLVLVWDTKDWVSSSFKSLFDFELDNCEIIEESCSDELEKYQDYTIIDEHQYVLNDKLKEKYKPFFASLKPSESVQKRICDFDKKYENVKYVSLQIRNNSDWAEFGRSESLDNFYAQMDTFSEDTKFYLSAMNDDVLNVVKAKYGDRILSLPDKNCSSMIDAVADLYLLARGESAIYSYGSTFAKLAYCIGGYRQDTQYVGNDSNWLK